MHECQALVRLCRGQSPKNHVSFESRFCRLEILPVLMPSMFLAVSSLSNTSVQPGFHTPNQPAAIAENPTEDEISKGMKPTPPFKSYLRLLNMTPSLCSKSLSYIKAYPNSWELR